MSGDDRSPRSVQQPADPEGTLSVDTIVRLLERAAEGARELDGRLRRVFELSESQASLRLK